MRDSKSIFFKYFVICSAVILISFICLGAVLLLVSSQYFIGEKKDLLLTNATDAVIETQAAMDSKPQKWADDMMPLLKSYALATNAVFFITDEEGSVITASAFNNAAYVRVPVDILNDFDDDGEYLFSNFNGYFNEEYHTVGMKFKHSDKVYYMIAAASKSGQDSYIRNIMELYFVSIVIVMIVVLILVYMATIKLTAPVKEIANAAKRIGQGHFNEKLPVYDTTEFRELGNAVNDMAVSLNNYDRMRSSFVANVSHELRTPMTSIGGFVDGMLDGTIPKEEQRKYLRVISSEVHRLTRLVRSMLNLARIESGAMGLNSENFSIVEPIVNTLVTFESRIESKNIEIKGLDVDRILVYADNDLVHQVVYNLLENAIKFVNESGYIEFTFKTENGRVSVAIKNSGEGLSEDELPLVFDRFYKTDESRGKDASGVGLGLNIVRSIIKLHNGTIMVRSVKGEYTEFVFTLPAKMSE